MNDDPKTAIDLLRRTESLLSALHGSVARHDNLAANLACAGCELRDQIRGALAAEPVAAPPTEQAGLRTRIAQALVRYDWNAGLSGRDTPSEHHYGEAAAVLAVLPPPADRATEAEAPLSPYYEHPECGFHWHGRDGMDIPMRDGQPVCPRCELAAAGDVLDRVRTVVSRLANHAVGFQDVLDDSDRDPWARTVGVDIAELRRLAAETPQPETQAAFVPPAHYRRDDGVDCCVHAIPVGPDSCRHCRELADDAPSVVQADGEADGEAAS